VWLRAGGFDEVSGWFVTTSWLFYAMSTATVFVQRRREKSGAQHPASYRTPLYPLTPIVFLVVTLLFILNDFTKGGFIPHTIIPRAMAGVLIAATGFPVYFLWRGRRRAAVRAPGA
jgi:amino acid permease